MRAIVIVTAVLILLGIGFYFFQNDLQRTVVVNFVSKEPSDVVITLSDEMSREEITEKIGLSLDFDERKIAQLHHTYRAMQWDALNELIVAHLVDTYNLSKLEREIVLTHSNIYLDWENDILESLYVSGSYDITTETTVVEIATVLIERMMMDTKGEFIGKIDKSREQELLFYIKSETELLPDIVPLPPQDVAIVDDGVKRRLVFTTIYYNQGDGPLEFHADPDTIGTIGDFDREVFQRINRSDGTYRERSSGFFEWHHEHVHYHFVDFMEYRLEGVDNEYVLGSNGLLEKSTFCIRDVSKVFIDNDRSTTTAKFRVCGRERQGVSVGWGDAYFNTYVDQDIDITGLPSGTYKLSFLANTVDRFDELKKDNNTASAIILYDADVVSVEVVSTEPNIFTEFEHVYVEQKI